MFFRNSLILLWTLQVSVKIVFSGELLNLNDGDTCFVGQQKGVCKSILKCDKPCSDEDVDFQFCGFLSDGIPTVCCPTFDQRISTLKCAEYKESACDVSYAGNRNDTPQLAAKIPNCSFTVIPLISGGKETKRKEFPHMALIGYLVNDMIEWNCGGTLISERFVLTAAHCVVTVKGLAKSVRLGEHDLNRKDDSDHEDYTVIEPHRHPNYTTRKHYFDIGLLKLDRIVSFTSAIRPACLPEQEITDKKAMVTGWGEFAPANRSNILLKVTVDLFPQDRCNNIYQKIFSDSSRLRLNLGINETLQVCAGSDKFMNNTCQGDSGGPLQVYHEIHYCSYTVLGVTSFGDGCRVNGSSSVYTRVYPYLEWIENIVWAK